MASFSEMLKRANDWVSANLLGKESLPHTEEESKFLKPQVVSNDQEMLSLILKKINELADDFNTRLSQVSAKVKDIEGKMNDDSDMKGVKEEINGLHSTLDEFSKFYELVCRQYDPFLAEKSKDNTLHAATNEVSTKQKADVRPMPIKQEKTKETKDKIAGGEKDNKLESFNKNEYINLISKAKEMISQGNVNAAEASYKRIMALYRVADQMAKLEIYNDAIQIRNKINSLRNAPKKSR